MMIDGKSRSIRPRCCYTFRGLEMGYVEFDRVITFWAFCQALKDFGKNSCKSCMRPRGIERG